MLSEHAGIFLPIFLWLLWVFGLYGLLSGVRVMQLGGRPGLESIEGRIAANLSNQFEAPLLLLAAVVLLLIDGPVPAHVGPWLWIFLFGRIIHTVVHVGQSRIVPRGLVFTINFAAVIALWVTVAAAVWEGSW